MSIHIISIPVYMHPCFVRYVQKLVKNGQDTVKLGDPPLSIVWEVEQVQLGL